MISQRVKPFLAIGGMTVLAVMFQNFAFVPQTGVPNLNYQSIDEIEVLPDGRVIASSESHSDAAIFSSDLKLEDSLRISALSVGKASPIRSLAVDRNGYIVMSDLKGTFKGYDESAGVVPMVGLEDVGMKISPSQLYYDRTSEDGYFYLLEKNKNTILRMKKDKDQTLKVIGDEFEFYLDEYKTKKGIPSGLAIYRDPKTRVARYFITESGKANRVFIYENIFEGLPVFVGDFAMPDKKDPGAIVADSQRQMIFVASPGSNSVHVFDPTGKHIQTIGGTGSSLGRFNNPRALALDHKGSLFVADSGNRRIQKFTITNDGFDAVAVGLVGTH